MELFSRLRIDPGDYQKPAAESIRDKLTAEQYRVTQESGTERAFTGEFWDKFEKGIYVDVVTAEPLFPPRISTRAAAAGPPLQSLSRAPLWWKEDLSHGMRRTEVRSRAGDPISVMCSPAIRSRQRRALLHQQRGPALRPL